MYKRESFGEQALYFNSVRFCTVKAYEETICLALGREILSKIFGNDIQEIIYKNIQRWAFDKSDSLCKLLMIQREKIIKAMILKNFDIDEIIFQKNIIVNKFVFILDGRLKKVFFYIYFILKISFYINFAINKIKLIFLDF